MQNDKMLDHIALLRAITKKKKNFSRPTLPREGHLWTSNNAWFHFHSWNREQHEHDDHISSKVYFVSWRTGVGIENRSYMHNWHFSLKMGWKINYICAGKIIPMQSIKLHYMQNPSELNIATENGGPYFYNFFSNLLRFWYWNMSHIFLITHKKFYDQKVFPREDSSENVTCYGNHN